MVDLQEILKPVIQALDADGYGLGIQDDENTVALDIVARGDACEECLSPPAILESLVGHLFAEAGVARSIRLNYPAQWHGDVEH